MIGLLISVAALYFSLRGVRWADVGTAIQDANYALVALAALVLCISLLFRTLRWRVLFHPDRSLSRYHLFGSLNVAYLINNILPFQVGDLGRAYLVSELEGVSATRSLSTVVVERMLDVFTLLLFLLIVVPFVDIPDRARIPSLMLGGLVALAAVAMIVASLKQDAAMRLVDRLLVLAPVSVRPKLSEMAHNALRAFSVLSNPRIAAELISWSVVIWLTVGLVVFLGMEAFGIHEGFEAALFLVVATTFGFLIPSSPGAFGIYHGIVIATLEGFGVDHSLAVSYALVIHMVFYLPPMFIGVGFLWKERRLWQRTNFMDKLRSLRTDAATIDPAPSR